MSVSGLIQNTICVCRRSKVKGEENYGACNLSNIFFFFTKCREGTGSNTELLLYTFNAYIIYLLIPNLNYYVCVIIPKMKVCKLLSTFEKAFVFLVNIFLSKICCWKKFPALEFDPFH